MITLLRWPGYFSLSLKLLMSVRAGTLFYWNIPICLGHCLIMVNTQQIFVIRECIAFRPTIEWSEGERRENPPVCSAWGWPVAGSGGCCHVAASLHPVLLWDHTCRFFLQLVTPCPPAFTICHQLGQCGDCTQQYPPTLLQMAGQAFSSQSHPEQINKGPFLSSCKKKKKKKAVNLVRVSHPL